MSASLRFVLRTVALAMAIILLVGCQYSNNRLDDFTDIFIVGGGYGGGIVFGPGGGIEVGAKLTEFLQPTLGASEMREFEIVHSRKTTYNEQTLGFPPAPILSLFAGLLPEPAVALRSNPRGGYLTMNLRTDLSGAPRYTQGNTTIALPASLRGTASNRVFGTENTEGLNHWWLCTPWADSEQHFLDKLDVQVEVTALFLSGKLGLSFGQFLDFAAGLIFWDPAGDDDREEQAEVEAATAAAAGTAPAPTPRGETYWTAP